MRYCTAIRLGKYKRVLDVACPRDQARYADESAYFARIAFGGRTSVSDIAAVLVSVVHGPNVDTGGVDFKAEYTAIADLGGWRAGVAGTRTLSWQIAAWLFGPAYDVIGRLNYNTSLARTVVDWKGRLWLAIEASGMNLRWTVHHTADYKHDADTEPRIDAHTTHDITAALALLDGRVVLDGRLQPGRSRAAPRLPSTQLGPADVQSAPADRSAWCALVVVADMEQDPVDVAFAGRTKLWPTVPEEVEFGPQ